MIKVPYIELGAQYREIKERILSEMSVFLDSGQFILGNVVADFEKRFAEFSNTKFAVGVANGTDALILVLKALGIGEGDEVITAPNSFLASASSIALVGAKPVFADVNDDFNINPVEIEKVITSRTKAIIPVHLTGRPAAMNEILRIAELHNLYIIEDAAQAVGAEYHSKRVGSFGTAGCFSLHPLKNLSAAGDGGMITTNDEDLYRKLLVLRNHGLKNRDECTTWSLNSRLDAIQALILNIKLDYLSLWEMRRREIARIYQNRLSNLVTVPFDKPFEKAVYHTFIIQTEKRNELKDFLLQKGVDTKVHYPIPIHLQEAAKNLGYKKGEFPVTEKQVESILSLPVYPELTHEQVEYVCDSIEEFFKIGGKS